MVEKILIDKNGQHYYAGLSSDTKPLATSVPVGSTFWETDTDAVYKAISSGWTLSNFQVALGNALAGERNTDSLTNSYLVVKAECNITRLDIDQTETLVTAAPAHLLWAVGNDGNTGYSDFLDASATGGGSTPKLRVNLGDGVNSMQFSAARFENGICVDGESSGHDITIGWRPI